MENVKCCFCGKELLSQREWNNPEPLCSDYGTVCCDKCNSDYVSPCRRVLWRPWVDTAMHNKLLLYFKSITLNELSMLLPTQSYMLTPQEYTDFVESLRKKGVPI